MSEPVTSVHAEESPSWAEVVRRAEHGDTEAVIAHGEHVADVVPSGELDRLRDTVEVLSDTELTARSAHDSRGRLTGRRSTATSCRSTRISAFVDRALRASSPNQATSCRKIRERDRCIGCSGDIACQRVADFLLTPLSLASRPTFD